MFQRTRKRPSPLNATLQPQGHQNFSDCGRKEDFDIIVELAGLVAYQAFNMGNIRLEMKLSGVAEQEYTGLYGKSQIKRLCCSV